MQVRLFASCNFVGAQQEEDIDVPDDTSDEDLQEMAEEFMNQAIAPEAWFRKLDDNGGRNQRMKINQQNDPNSEFDPVSGLRRLCPVGQIRFDVLEQTEYWQTRDGRVYLMTEMTPSHKINLKRFLYRNCLFYRNQMILAMIDSAPGDVATELMFSLSDRAQAVAWMKDTPFYIRLTELIAIDARRLESKPKSLYDHCGQCLDDCHEKCEGHPAPCDHDYPCEGQQLAKR